MIEKNIYDRVGVVITTNGYWGVLIRQCIECYIREFSKNTYIVVFINESDDSITLNLKNDFPQIEIIYIEDQIKFGGLTATWNKGIDLCFKNNKDIIILSNDDILFDSSITNIINEAHISLKNNELKYFGPITNNPGPADCNKLQYGLYPENKDTFTLKYNEKYSNINGFFMVYSKHVLLKNKYNETYYFDPQYPFGGNETEWFNRFIKNGGQPIIVPQTFIYHYKIARWRKNKLKNDKCIYTVNTGNYEGSQIYLNNINNHLDYDILYYSDNLNLMYHCIQNNIMFFYINTDNIDKQLKQRIVKTSPHLFLPYIYNTSIYIDGNLIPTPNFNNKNLNKLVNLKADIVCFLHPERIYLEDEANVILWIQVLASTESVNNIRQLWYKDINALKKSTLTETNCIIRKHKNTIQFNEEWTKCMYICIRDQLSFDFLLEKYNINYIKLLYNDKTYILQKILHNTLAYRNLLIKSKKLRTKFPPKFKKANYNFESVFN